MIGGQVGALRSLACVARVGDQLRGMHPSAYDPVPALDYGAAGAWGRADRRLGSTLAPRSVWVLGCAVHGGAREPKRARSNSEGSLRTHVIGTRLGSG